MKCAIALIDCIAILHIIIWSEIQNKQRVVPAYQICKVYLSLLVVDKQQIHFDYLLDFHHVVDSSHSWCWWFQKFKKKGIWLLTTCSTSDPMRLIAASWVMTKQTNKNTKFNCWTLWFKVICLNIFEPAWTDTAELSISKKQKILFNPCWNKLMHLKTKFELIRS